MSADRRLFLGGWIGGLLAKYIPWWDGFGVIALALFLAVVVKLTWLWAEGGRE